MYSAGACRFMVEAPPVYKNKSVKHASLTHEMHARESLSLGRQLLFPRMSMHRSSLEFAAA